MFSIISVNSFEVSIAAKDVNAKRMTIMAIGVLLHWTQASSFELVVRQNHGRPKGASSKGESRGSIEAIVPPNTYELTLLAMIVYNSENIIRNTMPFCHPLFCHRSVVNLLSILHLSYNSEPEIRLD